MITAGIDCGAKNTKTVIFRNGRIIGKGLALTGFNQAQAIIASWKAALHEAAVSEDDVGRTFGTGSGKNAIQHISGQINEIKAMAEGAHYFFPRARTVIDVGAEGARAARIDDNGHVVDFVINEKCAAGAGAFIEAMARALEVDLEEMGSLALQSTRQIPMNAQCVVFAESEVVGLIHAKRDKRDISRAILDAMASRIVSMVRRVGVNKDIAMIGGVGYNLGFIEAVKRELNLEKLVIPDIPEFGAAVGAAAAAAEET